MSSNITLSAGVRQNLLALQNTASLLGITQSRLATGKKVNSALDNPTSFFTSSSLKSRSSDLSALLDAMSNGINTIKAADNGITAITTTVETMKATITQARQDNSWKSTSFTLDTATIGTTVAKNLSISGGEVTGTVNIALNTAGVGGTQASVTTSGAYAAPTAAAAATLTGPAWGVQAAGETSQLAITYTGVVGTLNVTIGDTETTLTETVDKVNSAILTSSFNGQIKAQANAGKLEIVALANEDKTLGVTETLSGAGASILATGTNTGSDGQTQFTVSGDTVTLTSGDSPSLATAINTANLQLQSAGSAFEAYDAGGGLLGFREITAQGATLTIGGADASLFGAVTPGTAGTGGSVKTVDQLVDAINTNVNLIGKVKATNDGGKLNIQNLSTSDLTVTGASSTTIDGGVGTATVGGNTVRSNLVQQFNDLRTQLDKLADDASFNGINLLHGDTLKLVFNETNTSSISIVSQDANGINSSVLGIDAGTAAEFASNSELDVRFDALGSALSQLRSQASAFGSNLSIVQNRQEFTKSMITTLQVGADALVLADSNEEAANLLALQTRQQLSTTALSLASQADQAVLRLF